MKKQPTPEPELDDNALALRVIQAITGCGVPEAQQRLATIDVPKLVALERAGKRGECIVLLYGATSSPAERAPKPTE